MTNRLIERLSRWAVERRATILVLSLAIALGFGLQLQNLKVDTSPEALVTAIEGHEASEALFQKHFQRAESQVLVIVRAQDVTSLELLGFQYRVHRKVAALPAVSEVDGMTHLRLPATLGAPPTQEQLQALAQARAAHLRPGQSSPEGAPLRNPPKPDSDPSMTGDNADDPTSPGALSREILEEVVRGDPESFEHGLEGLAYRLQQAQPPPVLEGADPSEEALARYSVALSKAEWLRPALLSDDRTAAALVVHFDSKMVFDQSSKLQALNAIRAAVASTPLPKGAEVLYGGAPVMREVILDKLAKDRDVLNPAMAIVCLLVLAITFRWWVAVFAPLAAVAIAALFVIGSMAVLGQPLTILTNIIPPLLLIVGLSDSVHLLGRYQEELPSHSNRLGAGRDAAQAMLVACFLTSLTTAVGFASLATAKTPELRTFGVVAAIGVMAAYLATVFFVPAFVTLFPPPKSWLSRAGQRVGRGGRPRLGFTERTVFWLTWKVLRHAKAMVVVTLASAALFGWFAMKVSVDDRLLDIFEKGEETTRVTHLVEEKLSGIRPLEILLSRKDGSLLKPQDLHHIEQVMDWVEADPDIIAANSHVEQLREIRANLTGDDSTRDKHFASEEHVRALLRAVRAGGNDHAPRWVADEGRVVRLTVFFKDSGVKRSLELIEELRQRLADSFAEKSVEISFLGEAYTGSVGRSHVLSDLMSGLGLALVIIFGLLALLFGSFPLACVAMPPNLVPLVATGAYMTLRGIPLNLTTVITFSIGIGLAVDDTVHVVARFREERGRISSVRVALLRAARGTGRAIVVTALSLAAGFAVLTQSEFVSVRQFGELIAVTVGNCLVGALFIQPSLLYLMYRRLDRKRKRTSP